MNHATRHALPTQQGHLSQDGLRRTYRYLRTDWRFGALYLLLFTLPLSFAILSLMAPITKAFCGLAIRGLGRALPWVRFGRSTIPFTPISHIEFVTLASVYPTTEAVLANLFVALAIPVVISRFSWRGHPLSIFVVINAFYHAINCLFFLFAPDGFSISASDYSSLYISQEAGIWLAYTVLGGLVTAFVGNRGVVRKIAMCLVILAYSFVFGLVRYIVFLYVLSRFSVLYIALMVFSVGPLFDFLYFVMFYALFVNHTIKATRSYEGGAWAWS